MGQGATRRSLSSGRKQSDDDLRVNESNSSRAASYPAYPNRSAHFAPATTFLRSTAAHAYPTPSASVPEFHHMEQSQYHGWQQPRITSLSSGPATGRQRSLQSHRGIASRTQSDVVHGEDTGLRGAHLLTDEPHSVVSSSEAQQRREETYLDRTMAAAAEEVATMPAGELECLASGFLSLADFVYVAETMKGLSSLLLCGNDHAARYIGGKGNGQAQTTVSDTATAAAAAATTTTATTPSAVSGAHGANAVGALINDTTAAAPIMSGLPWTVMRKALLAQREARLRSLSGTSHTTSSTKRSVSDRSETITTIPNQRTTVLNSLTPSGTANPSSDDGTGEAERSTAIEGSEDYLKNASVSTATPLEAGLSYPAEASGNRSQTPSVRGTDATPLSATLGSFPTIIKTATTATAALLTAAAGASAQTSFQALSAPSAAKAKRPLSLQDLVSITTFDEVLDIFLQSMVKRMRGLARKLRLLTPFAALRYCIVTIITSAAAKTEAAPVVSESPPPQQQHAPSEAVEPERDAEATESRPLAVKGMGVGWIDAATIVERPLGAAERQVAEVRQTALAAMGDDVHRLFADTQGLLLEALTAFANAMPLGINSRINNNYLLPTEPILANFVGCGVHTRRRTEFFVSMEDRAKMLHGHQSFQSPEAVLLGISQLSNHASQMLSSFSVGAVVAFATRWRELHGSGVTSTDEISDVMEKFATDYCAGFDALCNDAFPALRKQYPNVFILSSFFISEEAGGRPPIVTVAVSVLLKLIFLFAGGLESIRADDRRLMAQALSEERQRRGLDQKSSVEAAVAAFNSPHDSTAAASPSSHVLASPHASKNVGVGDAHTSHEGSGIVPHPPAPSDSSHSRHERSTFLRSRTATSESHETSAAPTTTAYERRRGTLASSFLSTSRRSQVSTTAGVDPDGVMTDDIALSTALHVRSASLLVVIGATIANDPLAAQAPTVHESARLALTVSKLWRVLFQTAGLLPHGRACPKDMAQWLPLFPLYAVNIEAKRSLLQVYARTANLGPLGLGPLQRGNVLHSAAELVEEVVRASSEAHSSPTTKPSTKGVSHCSSAAHPPSLDPESTTSRATAAAAITDDSTASCASTTPTRNGRASISRSIAHAVAATTSHRLSPLFVVSSRKSQAAAGMASSRGGLRSASRFDVNDVRPLQAMEQRKELYELAAQQVAESFLPAVSLARESRAVPLPGGVATLHAERLEDRTAAALKLVDGYKDRLAVVVAWRKSAAVTESRGARPSVATSAVCITNNNSDGSGLAACPIRVGDEVTLRWTEPEDAEAKTPSPSAAATILTTSTNIKAIPAPQRHAVLAVLRTTLSSPCFVLVLDSPNYLSHFTVASTIAHPVAAVSAPRPRGFRKQASTADAASLKRANVRQQSVMSLQSFTLASFEEAAVGAPTIAEVVLYRRQMPLLTRDGATVCAWINPDYALPPSLSQSPPPQPEAAEQETKGSLMRPSQPRSPSAAEWAADAGGGLAVPTLLGWLLGQAPGNDVVLSLPLPPLAFRILSLAVHLEKEMEEVRLVPADISLRNPDYTREELATCMLEGMRNAVHTGLAVSHASSDDAYFSGSPAVARRQYQRLKSQLGDIFVFMAWNVNHSTAAARAIWAAVLNGLRQSPLMQTPVFAQCCARTLREVLCGPYDHPEQDFSFSESFVLLTILNAPLNVYRDFARKCVKDVLEEEFSVSEKRLLMRFITGHTLRTTPAHTEMICLNLRHGFDAVLPTKPSGDAADKAAAVAATPVKRADVDATLRLLPEGNVFKNTLIIPSYFEALLLGSYRETGLGADFAWLARRLSTGEADSKPVNMTADPIVLEESDYQLAWAGLSLVQQEKLKRRFRELLVHRLRAALYVFLVTHEDAGEQSWELAAKLGLDVSPATAALDTDASAAQDGTAAGHGGGAFMRRADGVLVFVDDASAAAGQVGLEDLREHPFDDDDNYDASMEEGTEDAAALLDNPAIGLFGDERSNPGTGGGGSVLSQRLSEQTSLQSELPSLHVMEGDHGVENLNGYHTAASFCFSTDDATALALAAAAEAAAAAAAAPNKTGDEGDSEVDVGPPKTLPAVTKAATPTDEEAAAGAAKLSNGNSSGSATTATATKSSGKSDLAPMAAAPPLRTPIVTRGVNTLLQHARVSHSGSSASRSAALPPNSPPKETASRSHRRSSHALDVPLPVAVGPGAEDSRDHSRNTSKQAGKQPAADLDQDIQELFPDGDLLAA